MQRGCFFKPVVLNSKHDGSLTCKKLLCCELGLDNWERYCNFVAYKFEMFFGPPFFML